jgi:hypothetical protein
MGYFLVSTSQSWRWPVSWYLQNQVAQNAEAGLYKSIYETAVMRALTGYANDDGGSCFPALTTLAHRSQCSERTVRRVLKEFEKRRWVRIKHTGRKNHYQIMAHGCVAPREGIFTENVGKPRIYRERVDSQSDQSGLTVRSDRSLSPARTDTESNDSYQIKSSNTPHQASLSCTNSADALRDRNHLYQGVGKEEGNEEEDSSFVTNPKNTTGVITPLDIAGDALSFPLPARREPEAQKYGCPCGFKHPPGMPSLEEIHVELRKLHPEADYSDAWVTQEAEYLHDIWLANGFRMKNGPIKNWKASLRNWERWQKEH